MFSLVKNKETVKLSSKMTVPFILQSYQQCMQGTIAPRPRQHVRLLVFWNLAILVDVEWYIVSIHSSLLAYDIERLFICLFVICTSFL